MKSEKPTSQDYSQSTKAHLDPTVQREHREMIKRNCEIQAKYELGQLLKPDEDDVFPFEFEEDDAD